MVQFIKKNWFYVGIMILVIIYFRKELKAYIRPELNPTEEKITQKKQEQSQSLLGLGSNSGITAAALPDIDEKEAKAFLRRFAKVAQGEQQKFRVPSAALLALAYVNSYSGKRALATEGNNYFARRCGTLWDGASMDLGGTCYRQYDKAWDSFRDASSQLSATRWAQLLIKSNDNSWEHWIKALEDNAYSDVPNAAAEMIKVIKKYRLFELETAQ